MGHQAVVTRSADKGLTEINDEVELSIVYEMK